MKCKTQTARKYLQVASDKRCVSMIYKEHSKLKYESRNPTDILPKKGTQMTNKQTERCSTSLVIKQELIKTTRCHYLCTQSDQK